MLEAEGTEVKESETRTGGVLAAVVELLKVKSIITIAIIFAMVFMALEGKIDPATFMTMAGSVITYYFTKRET